MKFNFLNGSEGSPSSKRLTNFILLLLVVIYFFSNLFFGLSLKPTLEDMILYTWLYSFTGVATEKLVNGGAKNLATPKTEIKITE